MDENGGFENDNVTMLDTTTYMRMSPTKMGPFSVPITYREDGGKRLRNATCGRGFF